MTRSRHITTTIFAIGLLGLAPATQARAAVASCSTTDHRCQARDFAAQAAATSDPSRRALFWHASFESYIALYDQTGSLDDLCAAKRASWRTIHVEGLSDEQRKPYQRARREFLARSPSTRCTNGRARPSEVRPQPEPTSAPKRSSTSGISPNKKAPSTRRHSRGGPDSRDGATSTSEHTSPDDQASSGEFASPDKSTSPTEHPTPSALSLSSGAPSQDDPNSQTLSAASITPHPATSAAVGDPGPRRLNQLNNASTTKDHPQRPGPSRGSSPLGLQTTASDPAFDRKTMRQDAPLLLAGGLAFAAGSTFGGVALYARRRALDTHANGLELHESVEAQPTETERAKDQALQNEYAAMRSLAIGTAITGGVLLTAAAVLIGAGGRRLTRARQVAWLPTGRGLAFRARF